MRRIVKLRNANNDRSMRINIPKDIAKEVGWTHGMTVMITTENGKLIITKEDE